MGDVKKVGINTIIVSSKNNIGSSEYNIQVYVTVNVVLVKDISSNLKKTIFFLYICLHLLNLAIPLHYCMDLI